MRNSIKMVQSACTFQSLWHENEKNYRTVLDIWGVMLGFWSLLCRNQLRWSQMCQWLNTDEKFWSHSQTPSSHEEETSQEPNADSKKWWLHCQKIKIVLISTDVINSLNTHTHTPMMLVRLKTSFRGYESPWRTCPAWFHQRQWADGQKQSETCSQRPKHKHCWNEGSLHTDYWLSDWTQTYTCRIIYWFICFHFCDV